MNTEHVPSLFQKKILWISITLVAFTLIIFTLLVACWGFLLLCGYLKPALVPLCIATILAYLLNPVVEYLCALKLKRVFAVIVVFGFFILGLFFINISVAPSIIHQSSLLCQKISNYSHFLTVLAQNSDSMEETSNIFLKNSQKLELVNIFSAENLKLYAWHILTQVWLFIQQAWPSIASYFANFIKTNIGGVFGFFSFLIGLIFVPIFLFFFLLESPNIATRWSSYLPLCTSPLKNEIVAVCNEVNHYLIHFFRGQLFVSMLDGLFISTALFFFLRLDFSFLIGIFITLLCLIPYFGIIICLIPSLLIAATQYSDFSHPLFVLIIFLSFHNINNIFFAPKIISHSVGLHPLTVIISIFVWTSFFGILIGPILAVPLTATLKVLLRRYVWNIQPKNTNIENNKFN